MLEIIGTAYVIDGAARLEAQLHTDPTAEIIFVAILGLTAEQELSLRRQLNERTGTEVVQEQKVDTDAPRLVISSRWAELTIESDPFVIPTARGYAPAILVRRMGAMHPEHVLVGAKSLSQPLETIRHKRGSLLGAVVKVRKTDDGVATSPYEVVTVG